MNMKKPLLTISIPTFNREKSLKKSLNALVSQVDQLELGWGLIEIFVSDNCSSDSTEKLVSEFKNKYPIRYSKNVTNLGMEGNFLKCFEGASGTYVWIFSDDDILLDDSLGKIIDLIREEPVDIIYFKPKFIRGELEDFDTKAIKFQIKKVTDLEFALVANGILSFLSAVLVNKNRYFELSNNPNTRRYSGTWLAHYEWIYTILNFGKNFYVVDKPIIKARAGATGGYDIFDVFSNHYLEIGRQKLSNKDDLRLILEKAMLYMHIPGFINGARNNKFGSFEYNGNKILSQILSGYKESYFYYWIIRTQISSNLFLSNFAYKYSQLFSRLWFFYNLAYIRILKNN